MHCWVHISIYIPSYIHLIESGYRVHVYIKRSDILVFLMVLKSCKRGFTDILEVLWVQVIDEV